MTSLAAPDFTPSRQIAVRPEWLAQRREEPLDPALPIVDPHHHLWDREAECYLLDDLLRDTAEGHDIRATVFIQCGSMYRASGPEEARSLGETEFVNGIAAASASGTYGPTRACAGIIGFVDLTLGDRVAPLLEAHVATARSRFRGVRNRTAWHPSPAVRSNLLGPPPGPLEDPRFVEGARRLAAHGLVLDIWAYQTQLPLVAAVARAVPELTVVVNHCGGPLGVGPYAGRREEGFAEWRREVLALAALPNTVMKLGGLAMEVGGHDFHLRALPPGSVELEQAWRPVVHTLIEAYGAGRCMFESNFPVDKGMVGYGVLWNAFKRLAAGAGEAERGALFAGTATRVYRLHEAPGCEALRP
ncbi:amidohydrolase family protein [Neoroseomonas oryzicola]|uniref:Amidohydrolase family protein n=1 Tax=Neoroseomonas oryzicola TaxID=535904 RepID=A0A9X9WKT6_9PROT|nr:amidohydrolase family protein [Neoroseomonas oryzicola]MBR0660946.1 amidohydrolase family protein [Neoroseomonas oryzicola]NKE19826.1 amidohydrolase family protein [Neoroseomonas oryzicola]